MKYTTVSIPKPLEEKIRKHIKNTGFSSVSSFVIFLIRQVLAENSDKSLLPDKEKIQEQLRRLGYLK